MEVVYDSWAHTCERFLILRVSLGLEFVLCVCSGLVLFFRVFVSV